MGGFRLLAVLSLALVPLAALAPTGAAYHSCDPRMDPSVGGVYLPPGDPCVGAAVGLGPGFVCRGASAHAGPAWIAVAASHGCTTGVIVTLP